MLKLFSDLRELVREVERETVVILQNGGKMFAVSTDLAESIEKLQPHRGSIGRLPRTAPSEGSAKDQKRVRSSDHRNGPVDDRPKDGRCDRAAGGLTSFTAPIAGRRK